MSFPTERPFERFKSEAWNVGSSPAWVDIEPDVKEALSKVGSRVRNSMTGGYQRAESSAVVSTTSLPRGGFARSVSTVHYPIVSDPFAASSRSTSVFLSTHQALAPPEEEESSFGATADNANFGEGELGWGDGDAMDTTDMDDIIQSPSPSPTPSPPSSPSKRSYAENGRSERSNRSKSPPVRSSSTTFPSPGAPRRQFKQVPSFSESKSSMLSNLRAQTFSSPEVSSEEAETFRRHASAGWKESLIPAETVRLPVREEEPWKELNLEQFAKAEDF